MEYDARISFVNRNGSTTSLELDATTVHLLIHLAETWRVSEEEAVRRALEQAHALTSSATKESRLEAFKELQRSLSLTSGKAAEWQDAIREARR
jgi:hypothetical protein